METKRPPPFWWMKPAGKLSSEDCGPKLDLDTLSPRSGVKQILETGSNADEGEVDVESIIEEINRVAAQSPLGPFDRSCSIGERSIDDIMKETAKIYMESSKSFEQLSQISKTSQNISEIQSGINSKMSTPTPKSVSPLPMDPVGDDKFDYSSDYSEDFSQVSKVESESSSKLEKMYEAMDKLDSEDTSSLKEAESKLVKSISISERSLKIPLSTEFNTPNNLSSSKLNSNIVAMKTRIPSPKNNNIDAKTTVAPDGKIDEFQQEIQIRNEMIKTLELDNGALRADIQTLQRNFEDTTSLVEKLRTDLNAKIVTSPVINLELEKALEELKDSKEINTSLQLQLDTTNKSHQLLKNSYDELLSNSKNLERKMGELDATLAKYKSELMTVQQTKTKLLENEVSLNKLLEIEKLQSKSLKLQNEKDSRCIQDLNRQIKEMERIIARKHPDSVSALIVAAKEDSSNTSLTARKLLEDRIKSLEEEISNRDSQSSKVFLEIQDKFTQMKNKYESHIEDLELHVSDLKVQLKSKKDTYDVYTQTFFEDNKKIVKKDTQTKSVQTDTVRTKTAVNKKVENGDGHLLATVRGLQTDLSNKEKVILKLQKEIEEVRKTNRRLQKEREGSLRNLSEKRDFRSYPEKLASYSRTGSVQDFRKEEEVQQLKGDRDRLKQQLGRIDTEFQALKKKRLDDLTALQEAHECEISNYMTSLTPLREQLQLQQVSIDTLQSQLTKAKEELAVLTVERDHLNTRLMNNVHCGGDGVEVEALLKKISFLEQRYEEREYRLRAIVQSLAQKSVTNRSCEQCAERQQQLIGYKVELDQLLATVRALK